MLAGEQYATLFVPFPAEAAEAAEAAVALGRGESLEGIADQRLDTPTERNVPAAVVEPATVTAATIGETVVRGGLYSAEEICAPECRRACERAGLLGGP